MPRTDLLIWLDLEMSGLEPDVHVILEMGCLLTDSNLALIAEGPSLIIHQPEDVLSAMDPWCVEQHGKSGLTEKVRQSKISPAQAEQTMLQFLQGHCAPRSSPLCGNSIGQDRRFLYKYMPILNDFFHYRNVDVSSIKELAKRWYAPIEPPEKKKSHQVMDDIRESVEELRFYRKQIFKPSL